MLSAWLLSTALRGHGLPAGCGPGGGCAAVLGSRWAGSWGIPVSAPATCIWIVALIAIVRRHERLLAASACMIVFAAAWFVALQFIMLRAVCPWCMADHAIGGAFAATVFAAPAARRRLGAALGLATLGLAVLVTGQFAVRYAPSHAHLLVAGPGGVMFSTDEMPSIGDASSTRSGVLLADYACPHCRAMHAMLIEMQRDPATRIRILVAPTPMNHRCNRLLTMTESRFEPSCDLARFALAVWHANPTQFAAFDAWLFEPQTPRSSDDARRRAIELVGGAALAQALALPAIDAALARNVDAFDRSGARRLPILIRVDGSAIEGEPHDAAELHRLLNDASTPLESKEPNE